jgi:hypothetical protein
MPLIPASVATAYKAIPPPVRAIVFLMLSGICVTGMNASVKAIASDIHPFVIAFFRHAVGVCLLTPMFLGRGANPLRTTRLGLHGLRAMLNVAAMLIAFTAILPLLDFFLQLPGGLFGWLGLDGAQGFFAFLTLDRLMGWMLAPLAFVLGVPWDDAVLVGALLGSKTVINEFVAFLQLSSALEQGALLHGKSVVIATYALCGFSNLASIGIQIGGLSVIAPTRRTDLAQLGFRAMIAASLACFMTAAVAGMLL